MDCLNENFILQLIREQQLDGYKALFTKYYKPLCIQANLLVKDSADAEDIVQGVFIDLWNKKKFTDITTSPGYYLSKSVKHACLKHLEQNKKKEAFLSDYSILTKLPEEDAIELQTLYIKMDKAIEQLPRQCRQTFRLIYYEKMKYCDVAELMEVSVNTVKTQMKIALSKLRTAIEAEVEYKTNSFSFPEIDFKHWKLNRPVSG